MIPDPPNRYVLFLMAIAVSASIARHVLPPNRRERRIHRIGVPRKRHRPTTRL